MLFVLKIPSRDVVSDFSARFANRSKIAFPSSTDTLCRTIDEPILDWQDFKKRATILVKRLGASVYHETFPMRACAGMCRHVQVSSRHAVHLEQCEQCLV